MGHYNFGSSLTIQNHIVLESEYNPVFQMEF